VEYGHVLGGDEMSIRVMTAVWEKSKATEGALIVNLAMADFAHDDGTGVWPSVPTLAQKARLSDRQVQRILRNLEGMGEIQIMARGGRGRRSTTRYTLTPGGDIMSPLQAPPPPLRVTPTSSKGDADVTRTVIEPLLEPKDWAGHPAIKAYQEIARLWPDRAIRPQICIDVGESPESLDRWRKTILAWIGLGWNKRNVAGMLEHFRDGRMPAVSRRQEKKPIIPTDAEARKAYYERPPK
jgi:hypothetical protein